MDARTTLQISSDEGLDERRLLGGDIELIRLHHVVKHHLARVFVLPFTAWSAACMDSGGMENVRKLQDAYAGGNGRTGPQG